MSGNNRNRLTFFASLALVAIAYFLTATFALRVHAAYRFASLVWAPTGIAIATVVLGGSRYWPAIAAGAFAANFRAGAPFAAAAGIALGNTLEAVWGVWLLRRVPGFTRSLRRVGDALALVLLGGGVATLVSATIGVGSLYLGGMVPASGLALTWRDWWVGDAIGALVVAPFLLTLGGSSVRPQRPWENAEAAVLGALLTAAALFLFRSPRAGMELLLSPFLVWACLRFEQRGAARATLVITGIAVWATIQGYGPFARGRDLEEGLFALQSFVALTAGTFLVLGAAVAERRKAEEERASDLRELERAHRELRRANEETEHANRAKDQFLAALSHELRTPLTPVLALASSLELEPALAPDTRRRIGVVRRNAELEARLIDDLLDLTRVARGKLTLDREPVPLAEAVDHVLEICREDAAAKGVTLEREGSDGGVSVLADPARLRQILWNLVKNGVKFTPLGGRVVVRLERPGITRVAVEVTDTGVGIDRAELARIFRPFEQGSSRAGGLGLGLAIAFALVDAHDGTLTAASAGPGRGSTFRIELPIGTPASRTEGVKLPRPVASTPSTRRILLVEDHADTLDATRHLLTELSCEVLAARTVAEAIRVAATEPIDLVVSDLGLPDGSGVDLMRVLRDRHGLSGIAVTGYGMDEDVRASSEAGFVEHLVKPITFQRLATAVERFFAGETVWRR
jgi:signal transduction histidine kinase/ActR/RegA family two-component response regulator